MAYGLQTFKENGAMEFDSEGAGLLRVISSFTATANVDMYMPLPPPYQFVMQTVRPASDVNKQLYSDIVVDNVGTAVRVRYLPYVQGGVQTSVNLQVRVMVLK